MSEPEHRATVSPATTPYLAKIGDRIIAKSARAVVVEEVYGEKTYRPVVYFPLEDVDQASLSPSDHHTFCPIKGEAGYYGIATDGQILENAAWFYPDPLPMVAAVKDHLAFYADKVTVKPS